MIETQLTVTERAQLVEILPWLVPADLTGELQQYFQLEWYVVNDICFFESDELAWHELHYQRWL